MIEYFILLCVEGVRPKLVMIVILYYRLVDQFKALIRQLASLDSYVFKNDVK